MMDPGIQITVLWFDKDVVELHVRASNGAFSGEAEVYADLSTLSDLSRALRGFPTDTDDSRDFELGTFDPKHALGGVRFRFGCQDRSGHASVEVSLRADPVRGGAGSASFSIPVEAAGVDAFVHQLDRMPLEVGARAGLKGAPQGTAAAN